MGEQSERVHSSGGITLSERLNLIESGQKEGFAEVKKWQSDHQVKDDTFQSEVKDYFSQRKGQMQLGNLFTILVGVIAAIASIYAAFVK